MPRACRQVWHVPYSVPWLRVCAGCSKHLVLSLSLSPFLCPRPRELAQGIAHPQAPAQGCGDMSIPRMLGAPQLPWLAPITKKCWAI